MNTVNLSISPTCLEGANAAVRESFLQAASRLTLPEGREVSLPGQACLHLAFLQTGSIRVYLMSSEGREITLYRVGPGESCVLTAACLLGGTPFPASATVEQAVQGYLVPAAEFRTWVNRHEFWQRYVFRLLGKRLAAVLARLEEATFVRVDVRLAAQLLDRAGTVGLVPLTHQSLASDLGTAREVVSRILKRWQQAGWVQLERGAVRLVDTSALRDLSKPKPPSATP